MSAAAAKTAKGFTSLQELFIDEFTLFKQESLKLKCFRLINLYGVFSSLVSAILDIQLPITLSLDIYSLVGSLIALKMTRDWRLQEVPQKKRVLRFRLNAIPLYWYNFSSILIQRNKVFLGSTSVHVSYHYVSLRHSTDVVQYWSDSILQNV